MCFKLLFSNSIPDNEMEKPLCVPQDTSVTLKRRKWSQKFKRMIWQYQRQCSMSFSFFTIMFLSFCLVVLAAHLTCTVHLKNGGQFFSKLLWFGVDVIKVYFKGYSWWYICFIFGNKLQCTVYWFPIPNQYY